MARDVTVTVPPNTSVLEIAYAAPTAALAQQGAQAVAEAYLESRAETAQVLTDNRISRTLTQIQQTTAEQDSITAELNDPANGLTDAEEQVLRERREQADRRLVALNSTLASLNTIEIKPGTVINDALLPGSPRDPNPVLVIPSSLMLGLLAGLGVAVLRERRDPRLHDDTELERLFGLTELMTLPPSWVTDRRPRTHDKDIRTLFHTLQAQSTGEVRTVLVVGPGQNSVAERVSTSLAVFAARSGIPTTLVAHAQSVSGHPRRRMLGDEADPNVPGYEDIGLLTDAGLASWQFEPKLRELAGDGEDGFVVLDMPTGELTGDLPVLARHVDIVAIVVEYNTTTRDELRQVLDDLSRSGAKTVVVIAVASPSARRRAHAQLLDDRGQPQARAEEQAPPIAAREPYGHQDDEDEPTRDERPSKARWGDATERAPEDHPGGITSRRPR